MGEGPEGLRLGYGLSLPSMLPVEEWRVPLALRGPGVSPSFRRFVFVASLARRFRSSRSHLCKRDNSSGCLIPKSIKKNNIKEPLRWTLRIIDIKFKNFRGKNIFKNFLNLYKYLFLKNLIFRHSKVSITYSEHLHINCVHTHT